MTVLIMTFKGINIMKKLEKDKQQLIKWVYAHVSDENKVKSYLMNVLQSIVDGEYTEVQLKQEVANFDEDFKYAILRNFREDDYSKIKILCDAEDEVMRFSSEFLAKSYAYALATGEHVEVDLKPYGMKVVTITSNDAWGLCPIFVKQNDQRISSYFPEVKKYSPMTVLIILGEQNV